MRRAHATGNACECIDSNNKVIPTTGLSLHPLILPASAENVYRDPSTAIRQENNWSLDYAHTAIQNRYKPLGKCWRILQAHWRSPACPGATVSCRRWSAHSATWRTGHRPCSTAHNGRSGHPNLETKHCYEGFLTSDLFDFLIFKFLRLGRRRCDNSLECHCQWQFNGALMPAKLKFKWLYIQALISYHRYML